MPTKWFQKGREEGNTFPYLCRALNPLHGQYHKTCDFHSDADCTGPGRSPSLPSVEVTLMLVPALGELGVFFDTCKEYLISRMHSVVASLQKLVLYEEWTWILCEEGSLGPLRKVWQYLNMAVSEMWGPIFLFFVISGTASRIRQCLQWRIDEWWEGKAQSGSDHEISLVLTVIHLRNSEFIN